MKTLKSITMLALFFLALGVNAQNEKEQKIIDDAERVKQKMLAKDNGLEAFFNNSSGYVIFPNVGEGALIVGGASGNGVVYENGSPIGMADLKKIDVGLQAGGQAIAEVIFFETDAALAEFKDGEFTFSAEAAAVILEKGASKNANYSDGVVVFAMPKAGVMADASIGGQNFSFHPFDTDKDVNK